MKANMLPTAAFDFRKSLRPQSGSVRPGCIGDMTAPEGTTHPRFGLEFPLASGGFAFHSGKVITDAAGSLEVVFRLRTMPAQATLIQAWGQYEPLIALTNEALQVTHLCPMRVAWKTDANYTLKVDWDHRAGISVSLKVHGGKEQTLRWPATWRAFRQEHIPFGLGGSVSEPRFRKWHGTFQGWLRSLKIWSAPRTTPGPAEVRQSGEPIRAPFPAAPGIRVLAFDEPPVIPDPLGLDQLPDRFADLRKTRRVCGLDAVTAPCRGELEVFAMLTWHLGNLWPHSYYWPWKRDEQREIFWKRGHEMIPKIKAGRAGGMCGGYAHMMEETFWAMGFDARRIQVRAHSSFEAYSNQLDRWIICDASYGRYCHLLAGPDGQPVGAREVIRAYERRAFDPQALDGFQPLYCNRQNLQPGPASPAHPPHPSRSNLLGQDGGARSAYLHYDSVGLAINKTKQHGRHRATPEGDHSHVWYLRACDRASFPGSPSSVMGKESFLVDDLAALYPSRNRCAVRAAWTVKGEILSLAFRPVGVTFFDSFEIEVDGETRRITAGSFRWTLHGGVNELRVRTVNRLGAKGYPWSLTLYRRPV